MVTKYFSETYGLDPQAMCRFNEAPHNSHFYALFSANFLAELCTNYAFLKTCGRAYRQCIEFDLGEKFLFA